VVSKEVFAKIDHILIGQLIRWGFRRHNKKSKHWVIDKYFKTEGNRKWVFKDTFEDEKGKQTFTLKRLADIPITRHVKIKMNANPFDTAWDAYFEKRRCKRLKVRCTKSATLSEKTCKSR
jgi:RNA-directed DNA polymerase